MSSEPTVEQSAGGVEGCVSYHPGHNTHWIPVLSKYPNSPRAEAKVLHIEGKQITVTSMGRTYTYYFHDPEIVKAFIERRPNGFKHVLGTTFVLGETQRGHAWIYMSEEPLEPCGKSKPESSFKPYPNRRVVEND